MALILHFVLHAFCLLSCSAFSVNHTGNGSHTDNGTDSGEKEQVADFFFFEHLLIQNLEVGTAPPFYFIWITSILKIMISLVLFGPAKPGTQKDVTSLSQKASLFVKRCIQLMVAFLCFVSFIDDIANAIRIGTVLWQPPEIEGLRNGMSDLWILDKLVRFLGGASIVFSSSSVISSIATVSALKGLYRAHYIMEFCHKGDTAASEKVAKGELPQCKRHGKKNLLEAAGHQDLEGDSFFFSDGEAMMLMQEKEGFVLKYYMKLIEILFWFYMFMCAFWVLVGMALYLWLFMFCILIQIAVAQKCAEWMVGREEKKQAAVAPAGQPAYVAQLQELENPEAIYYFMLEYKSSNTVVLTKDVSPSEIYQDATGSEVHPQSTSARLVKDAEIMILGLTYELLFQDPEDPSKRIKVPWSVTKKSGKNNTTETLEGWIAVDCVKPKYTQEEAEEEYKAKIKSYHFTGSTDDAWMEYFVKPMAASLLCTIFGTLGARYVVGLYAWPVTNGKTGWAELWFYYTACLRMLSERTMLSYLKGLQDALMHSSAKALNLLNLFF